RATHDVAVDEPEERVGVALAERVAGLELQPLRQPPAEFRLEAVEVCRIPVPLDARASGEVRIDHEPIRRDSGCQTVRAETWRRYESRRARGRRREEPERIRILRRQQVDEC